MVRKIGLLVAILTLVSCAGISSYNPREHNSYLFNLYWSPNSWFYHKLDADNMLASELQKQQIVALLEAKALPKDEAKISEARRLIGVLERLLDDYANRDDLLLETPSAPSAWRASNEVYIWVVQSIADMRIRLGKAYARLGKKEEAKETLRSVVINYTGTAYQSQVRDAQFALEDLR